jgi:DNA-binding NtrC family response regulator
MEYQTHPYPLVITDIRMPGGSGIELLENIKRTVAGDDSAVIIITAHGDMQTSIAALRAGAYDYLLKPVNLEVLSVLIDKVAEYCTLKRENKELQSRFSEKFAAKEQELESKAQHFRSAYAEVSGIGTIGIFSAAMRNVHELAEKFADNPDVPVLIEGETGTGKEIIARKIHFQNDSGNRPFVTINCSAITPTLFESELFGYESGAFTGAKAKGSIGKLELAQGGSIFLDEIGDMPMEMQPKLLRTIQQKEMYRIGGTKKIKLDVRFICATNRDLTSLMEKNLFRRDLYFRLNTAHIIIPPLRDRTEEIAPLAQMFLKEQTLKRNRNFKYIENEAIQLLEEYTWPGNVRELKNAIERVTLVYDDFKVRPDHFDFLSVTNDLFTGISKEEQLVIPLHPDKTLLDDIEEEIIRKIVKKFSGNITKASEFLGISRNRLKRKLNRTT